jgi:hypothetical protein
VAYGVTLLPSAFVPVRRPPLVTLVPPPSIVPVVVPPPIVAVTPTPVTPPPVAVPVTDTAGLPGTATLVADTAAPTPAAGSGDAWVVGTAVALGLAVAALGTRRRRR